MVESKKLSKVSSQTRLRYLFVIRHGERKDHEPELYPEYESHPDAPLTPKGHDQAQKTGLFLKNFVTTLQKENVKTAVSVTVESSPFARCLQTAAEICKLIGVPKCVLNYKCAELLTSYMFPTDPLPTL